MIFTKRNIAPNDKVYQFMFFLTNTVTTKQQIPTISFVTTFASREIFIYN